MDDNLLHPSITATKQRQRPKILSVVVCLVVYVAGYLHGAQNGTLGAWTRDIVEEKAVLKQPKIKGVWDKKQPTALSESKNKLDKFSWKSLQHLGDKSFHMSKYVSIIIVKSSANPERKSLPHLVLIPLSFSIATCIST